MPSWVPFIIGLVIFETIADIWAKEFELTNSWIWYAWALMAYVLGNALWLFAMKKWVGLWRWTILFGVITTIVTLLIAYVYYREPVNTTNIIWIILCLVWLVLVER